LVSSQWRFWDCILNTADKEIEILHGLALEVLEYEEFLASASNVIGDFDSLLALAKAARKYNWKSPVMTTSNIIQIPNGRHPLHDLIVSSYIPNDCEVRGGGDYLADANDTEVRNTDQDRQARSIMVLTGPNNSGKSVYLKQVGLTVYLAHVGSFVPADKAVIGMTDKILTSVATRESFSRNESTFAIDLAQVGLLMSSMSRRSLILVDEFGKGTRSDIGAALFGAFVDHCISLGPEQPRVLVVTHFHEVFEANRLDLGRRVIFRHMGVQGSLELDRHENRPIYLYKLLPGVSTSSFAIECAR
jgi:DNA mismatch repair protein MSH5